jgi:hypothetical protein
MAALCSALFGQYQREPDQSWLTFHSVAERASAPLLHATLRHVLIALKRMHAGQMALQARHPIQILQKQPI